MVVVCGWRRESSKGLTVTPTSSVVRGRTPGRALVAVQRNVVEMGAAPNAELGTDTTRLLPAPSAPVKGDGTLQGQSHLNAIATIFSLATLVLIWDKNPDGTSTRG